MKRLCMFNEVVKMINFIKEKSVLNNYFVVKLEYNGKWFEDLFMKDSSDYLNWVVGVICFGERL